MTETVATVRAMAVGFNGKDLFPVELKDRTLHGVWGDVSPQVPIIVLHRKELAAAQALATKLHEFGYCSVVVREEKEPRGRVGLAHGDV